MRKLFIHFMVLVLIGCDANMKDSDSPVDTVTNGTWRAVLSLENDELPFNFEIINDMVKFINADEQLQTDGIVYRNDSIIIPGYVFDSEIRAIIIDSGHIKGEFLKFDYGYPYSIPFEAWTGKSFRFSNIQNTNNDDITGRWKVIFDHEGDTTMAIGVFEQNESDLKGTFLTATGDYRYLQGEVNASQLQLSTFDGSHAFLFKAELENDTLKGEFFSGIHWSEKWTAVRDQSYQLPNPDSLTFLVNGTNRFEFSFPNVEDGEPISNDDDRFRNKVTIIQIMGSWCPNCMDETKFLIELKNKFPEIEIVGLAFEKYDDFEKASKRIRHLKQKLSANYDFAIAGTHNKKSASESLPMLNKIISYPTTILIGKNGEVKNIHTGFSGPGTGEKYENFKANYILKVENLINQ